MEEQRHNIAAITEALSAFPIERQKANANKMAESIAGLSRKGLIVPLSFYALYVKDRERQGRAGE